MRWFKESKNENAVSRFVNQTERRRIRVRVVSILACFVFILTACAMIMPALTLASSADTFCGLEQHVHNDGCYEIPGVAAHYEYTCEVPNDGSVIHQHTDYCYDENGTLICTLPEVQGESHTHNADCYKDGVLTCDKVEITSHQHSDMCRINVPATEPQNLICTKEEHVHDESCMIAKESAEAPALLMADSKDASEADKDALSMSKQIRATDQGYMLRMETFVTGTTVIEEIVKPVDIVLTLDVSGSMEQDYVAVANNTTLDILDKTKGVEVQSGETYYQYLDSLGYYKDVRYNTETKTWQYDMFFYGWTDIDSTHTGNICICKKTAMEEAVVKFINNIKELSPESRIAIVKYAGDKVNTIGNSWDNDNDSAAQQVCGFLALTDKNVTTLIDTVKALKYGGPTRSDYGMDVTNSVMTANTDTTREKYVVFMTDGRPTYSDTFSTDVANGAIGYAKTMKSKKTSDNKDKMPVTIYTVGTFAQSDLTDNVKTYMNAVSSNYPNASSMTSLGTKNEKDSYFMTTDNAEGLMEIFNKISTEIGQAGIELGPKTELQDGISEYFNILTDPESGKWEVQAYTMSLVKQGDKTVWVKDDASVYKDIVVTTDNTKKRVTVSGFDYSENYVDASVPRGKKLIVDIPIDYVEGVSGVVPSNTPDSGIYVDGEALEPLPQPIVELPTVLNITCEAKHQAAAGTYNFTGSAVLKETQYTEDEYTKALYLDGFLTDDPFALATKSATTTPTKTYFVSDDAYDEVKGNDTVTIKEINVPTGYTVSATAVSTVVDTTGKTTSTSDLDVSVVQSGNVATITFLPTGSRVDLNITMDYKPESKLTVACEAGSGVDLNNKYHYTVTYTDYEDAPKTVEFDLKDGESKDIEKIPTGKTVKVVVTGANGYHVAYYLDEEEDVYKDGTECELAMTADYVLTCEISQGVELPATGSTGALILTVGGILLVLAAVAGLVLVLKQKENEKRKS